MAHLDQIKEAKVKGKKKKGLEGAVASTEKIRGWVEHTLELEALEKQLETKIYKTDSDKPGYQGLTEFQV